MLFCKDKMISWVGEAFWIVRTERTCRTILTTSVILQIWKLNPREVK